MQEIHQPQGSENEDPAYKRVPISELDLTPPLSVVSAKPKPIAALLSSRRMSASIVSSLSQSKQGGSSSKESKMQNTSSPVVPIDAIVSPTNVTKEFPIEANDTIATIALGPTHTVLATSAYV